MFRASMATAYVGLALMALTLLLGPANVLRGRPNPLSTDPRRDFGIWAGLVGIAHVVVGLQVHVPGRPWLYFLWPASEAHVLPIRYDFAGIANYTGLAAAVLLVGLLLLSNDRALRRLGPARWKSLQRLNYLAFALVATHGVTYQLIERRSFSWVSILVFTSVFVGMAQFLGWRRVIGRVRPPVL